MINQLKPSSIMNHLSPPTPLLYERLRTIADRCERIIKYHQATLSPFLTIIDHIVDQPSTPINHPQPSWFFLVINHDPTVINQHGSLLVIVCCYPLLSIIIESPCATMIIYSLPNQHKPLLTILEPVSHP